MRVAVSESESATLEMVFDFASDCWRSSVASRLLQRDLRLLHRDLLLVVLKAHEEVAGLDGLARHDEHFGDHAGDLRIERHGARRLGGAERRDGVAKRVGLDRRGYDVDAAAADQPGNAALLAAAGARTSGAARGFAHWLNRLPLAIAVPAASCRRDQDERENSLFPEGHIRHEPHRPDSASTRAARRIRRSKPLRLRNHARADAPPQSQRRRGLWPNPGAATRNVKGSAPGTPSR